jgi:hypothetical protein
MEDLLAFRREQRRARRETPEVIEHGNSVGDKTLLDESLAGGEATPLEEPVVRELHRQNRVSRQRVREATLPGAGTGED